MNSMAEPIIIKHCPKCSADKCLDDFRLDKYCKDGRSRYCRDCMSEAERLKRLFPKPIYQFRRTRFDESTGLRFKVCCQCNIEQSEADFGLFINHGRQLLRSCCRRCEAEAAKQRRIAAPVQTAKIRRAFYLRNVDALRADARARARTARERRSPEDKRTQYARARAWHQRYYVENKHALSLRSQQWKRNNPLKRQEYWARYYAAKLGTSTIEGIDRAAIIKRDNSTCYLCLSLLSPKQITLDHVIPLSRGGSHTAGNLKVACGKCNSKKGARLLSELDLDSFREAA